ncbi:magnesium transporter MgtE N-terminal domain-containing protein, partial [Acidobacteriota bacterium]
MTSIPEKKPWEVIENLMQANDIEGARAQLESMNSRELLLAFSRMERHKRTELLGKLDPEFAACVLEPVSEERAADFIEELDPTQAANSGSSFPKSS